MNGLGLAQQFVATQHIPELKESTEVASVLRETYLMSNKDAETAAVRVAEPIGVKRLLMVADMTRERSGRDGFDLEAFSDYLEKLRPTIA